MLIFIVQEMAERKAGFLNLPLATSETTINELKTIEIMLNKVEGC